MDKRWEKEGNLVLRPPGPCQALSCFISQLSPLGEGPAAHPSPDGLDEGWVGCLVAWGVAPGAGGPCRASGPWPGNDCRRGKRMRPVPHWRPGHRATGAYRGPMVQCPHCGYSSWRGPTCPFCGAAFEAATPGRPEGSPPRTSATASSRPEGPAAGFPTLFLAWFLVGLLLGIVGFSPRSRAAGAMLWPRAERQQQAVRWGSVPPSPPPMASHSRGPTHPTQTR